MLPLTKLRGLTKGVFLFLIILLQLISVASSAINAQAVEHQVDAANEQIAELLNAQTETTSELNSSSEPSEDLANQEQVQNPIEAPVETPIEVPTPEVPAQVVTENSTGQSILLNDPADQPETPVILSSNSCYFWPQSAGAEPTTAGAYAVSATTWIIKFPSNILLRADQASGQYDGETGVTLPSGQYTVGLHAWDGNHPNGQVQPNEQAVVEFLDVGGNVLATSNPSSDIPDDQKGLAQIVNRKLQIPEGAVSLRLAHAAYPNSNPNSLYPPCAYLEKIPVDDGGEDPQEPSLQDTTNPYASLKFLDTPEPVTDNQTTIQVAGCYYVTKIYHEGMSGKLNVIHDGNQTLVSDNYNAIPNYTYLGYYDTGDGLLFRLEPFYNLSPDEVLSSDPNRTKIEQLAPDVWRFYFEDWSDNDFNDLVLEVARGDNCDGAQIGQSGELSEPQGESLVFSQGDTVSAVYFAKDEPNEEGLDTKIVAARFLDEFGQADELTYFSQFSGELPVKTLAKCNGSNCLVKGQNGNPNTQLDNSYYAWGGQPIWAEIATPVDGLYIRSLEVVDAYGNKTTVTRSVVRDTSGPEVSSINNEELIINNGGEGFFKLNGKIKFNLNDVGLSLALANPDLASRIGGQNTLQTRLSWDQAQPGDWQTAALGQNTLNFPELALTTEQLETLKTTGKLELTICLKAKDQLNQETDWIEVPIVYKSIQPQLKLSLTPDANRNLTEAEKAEIQADGKDQNVGLDFSQNPLSVGVSYDSSVGYQINLNQSDNLFPIKKIRLAEKLGDFSDEAGNGGEGTAATWIELDPTASDYQAQLTSLLSGTYDFAANNGYEPIGFFNLCVQAEDTLGRMSEPSCGLISLEFNIEPIYDPKGPFADQPVSCSNPYGWIEIRDQRTETTKSYFEKKTIGQVTKTDGTVSYIRSDYDPDGNLVQIEIPADQYVANPNPTEHPSYFKQVVCAFTDKIHYTSPSTDWWENVDNYLIKLSPNTTERQAGYVYKSTANDFTVYFGDNTQEGFWFFSQELDFKVDKITIGTGDNQKELNFAKARVRNNTITYPEVLEGVDLVYQVTALGVSKYIVIKNHQGLQHDFSEINFEINTNKKLIQDGQQIRLEGTDNVVMQAPFTMEINSDSFNDNSYSINADSTRMTIYGDQDYLNSPDRTFPILIDPTFVTTNVAANAFVQRSNPDVAPTVNGNKHYMLSVGGNFTDTSIGASLSTTRSFLRFDLSGTQALGRATEAYLTVRQYNTYNGPFQGRVRSLNTDFNANETTWNHQPGMGKDYGHINFNNINRNGSGNNVPVNSSNIAGLVNDQKASSRALIGLIDSNENYARGTAFCSKDVRGSPYHPCSPTGQGPSLYIVFNNLPTPPVAQSPDNADYLGNCDLSVTPATGNCSSTMAVPFTVSNINGGDDDDGAYNIELSNKHLHPGYWYQTAGYKGMFKGADSRVEQVANGNFDWAARNQDLQGDVSALSASKSLIVDTQSPSQIGSLNVPAVAAKGQISFNIPQYTDNLINKVIIRIQGKNIAMDAATSDLGANIYLHNFHGGYNQQWVMEPDGRIRGVGNKCVDYNYSNGNIYLFDCHDGWNQKWEYTASKQLKIRDTSTHPNPASRNQALCIDGMYTNSGDNLYIFGCHSGNNQKFDLTYLTPAYPLHPNLALSYFVEVNSDPTFAPESTFYSGWQSSTNFQLACTYDDTGFIVPADKLDETTQIPRTCLQDGTTYYVRIKAKDRQHSLDPLAANNGNISKWSETKSFKVDLGLPIVRNLSLSETRISPTNPTSVGVKDTTEISVEFSTKNWSKTEVQVRGQNNQIVRTISTCLGDNLSSPTTPVDCNSGQVPYVYNASLPQKDDGNFKQVNFIFDGRNDAGQPLPDGAYSVIILTYNQAGDTNDLNLAASRQTIVIDNTGANLGLSTPKNRLFTNSPTLEISGQVATFNQAGKEDKDFDKLEIRKLDLDGNVSDFTSTGFDWQEVPLGVFVQISPGNWQIDPSLFKYNYSLDKGLNHFEFRLTDSAGNVTTTVGNPLITAGNANSPFTTLEVYYDNKAPEFVEILPIGELAPTSTIVDPQDPTKTVNQYAPTIQFTLTDDSLAQELLNAGFNPNQSSKLKNYDLSLLYSANGQTNWIEFPVLNQGTDISGAAAKLGQNLECGLMNNEQLIINNGGNGVTCSLRLENLPFGGAYRPVIKFSDLAGNSVCNINPADYLSFESVIGCSTFPPLPLGEGQGEGTNFDPNVTFVVPQTSANTENVLITSPESGYLSDRGVINVMGLGPKSEGSTTWQVTVCIDTLTVPNDDACDFSVTTNTDENGIFSVITLLPALANQHVLFAVASKSQNGTSTGETTNQSNLVLVKVDTLDPFKKVEAIPSFYGINSQAEIDAFLSGNLSIDELRTIQLRSTVTQNTEGVDLDFADYSGLDTLPNTDPLTGYSSIYHPDGKIAVINGKTETEYKWNPWELESIKQDQAGSFNTAKEIQPQLVCGEINNEQLIINNGGNEGEDDCLWVYNYPTPFWLSGGIYEVRFRGYKGTTVQDLTQGVAVNGTLTSSPRLLRVIKVGAIPQSPDGTDQIAKQDGTDFYTNTKTVKLVGVADAGASIKIEINNEQLIINNGGPVVLQTTANSSGIWEAELTLPEGIDEGRYTLKLTATLNNYPTEALETYGLVLDTILPRPLSVKTTNLSNTGATNPWLMTGDEIGFEVTTNEPLASASVFGELGYQEVLGRQTGANSTPDEVADILCQTFQICSQAQLGTTNFSGSLTVMRPLQGTYIPYLKLTDLAGNTAFYANNSNIANINIDPFDQGAEDSQPKIYLDPSSGEIQNGNVATGNQALPQNYPYSITPRGQSLDFRLYIDNRKTDKGEMNVDGWGDRRNAVYAGKAVNSEQLIINNGVIYDSENPPLPEADRLLTDQQYFTDTRCEIDLNQEGKESIWKIYDATNTDAAKCGFQPNFVIKQNQLTITGWGEANQQVILTEVHGESDKDGNQINYQTDYHTVQVPNQNSNGAVCVDYATNPELYPPLANTETTTPGDPIPGVHVDNVERGGIITKFAAKCRWTFSKELTDNGMSEAGVPANWYRYSFHTRDLAGNTPIEEINNEQLIMNNEGNGEEETGDNGGVSQSFESKSVTIYHDTEAPKYTTIANVKSASYDPVVDWYNQNQTPITKDTAITVKHYGERAADVEYRQNRRLNASSGGLQATQKQILNTSPDNVVDEYTKLLQNGYNGNGETDLNLYADTTGTQRDQDQVGCTAMHGTRRVGTCNDGLYDLSLRMTDSAGNKGDWVTRTVERDTVAPVRPGANIVESSNEFALKIDIQGESGSTAILEGDSTGNVTLNSNGSGSIWISNYLCSSTFNWTVHLQDRAGNSSESINLSYTTKPCPIRMSACGIQRPGFMSVPFEDSRPITSDYGEVRYYTVDGVYYQDGHDGLDFAMPVGTEVLASADGYVNFTGWDSTGGGNMITVYHPELDVRSAYLHLSKILVKNGQRVTAGQVIGLSGNTGRSTGPHLHFGVVNGLSGWETVSPWMYLVECLDPSSSGTYDDVDFSLHKEIGDSSNGLEMNLTEKYVNFPTKVQEFISLITKDLNTISGTDLPVCDEWKCAINNWSSVAKLIWDWVQSFFIGLMYGLTKSIITTSIDFMELFYKAPMEVIEQFFEGIMALLKNPEVAARAIFDKVYEVVTYFNSAKTMYERASVLGTAIGEVLGAIIVSDAIYNSIIELLSVVAKGVAVAFDFSKLVGTEVSLGTQNVKSVLRRVDNYLPDGGKTLAGYGIDIEQAARLAETLDDASFAELLDNIADPIKREQLSEYRRLLDDPARSCSGGKCNLVDEFGNPLCFVAGTLISTKDGLKPIEQIKVGDFVLSKNPETGEVSYKPVVNIFTNRTEYITRTTTESGNIIESTPTHEIYTQNKGWVHAHQLEGGDELIDTNGNLTKISSVGQVYAPQTVYNFEVEDWHTYFAGGVWVHNACLITFKDLPIRDYQGDAITELFYVRPKNYKIGPYKPAPGGGAIDADGRIWTVDKLHRDHFDVQLGGGKYLNVAPDGRILR